MLSNNKKLIAVIGATGQQGSGVVRALQANGQFKVRALTRDPGNQVAKETFAGFFPGASEIAEMLSYWEAHSYLGSDSFDQIALANKIAGREPTRFSIWAEKNFPRQLAADGSLH